MKVHEILHWTPRALGILFALFLSVFALDAFAPGTGFGRQLTAFLIHLAPTFLVVVSVVIAWRRERLGAFCFFLLGLCYLVLAWQRFPYGTLLLISGPLFLIGVLFLLDWRQHRPPA